MDSIDISQNYLVIDKFKNKAGDQLALKEHNNSMIIKQYSGIGTDNFIIKKYDGKKLSFSFFKLNGIHYININGEHIFDYKKFINIQQISNVGVSPPNDEELNDKQLNCSKIKIKNAFIGDFIIKDCDIEIFKKALDIMNNYMKNHKTYISDIVYYLFN